MSYICPTCKKTRKQLVKEKQLNLVQGYEQCGYCHSDMEHESVVLRSDLLKDAQRKAEENNDYEERPCRLHGKIKGVPKTVKYTNSHKYLPEWYQKELEESLERTNKMFRDLHKSYGDYNKIID